MRNFVMAGLVVLALTAAAPTAHAASCCIPHSGTGCDNGSVQSCVCAMDPYCCNNNWDSICAGEADQCGSCTGDCCASNGTPGCDTESCEVSVCEIDPFCCNTAWDGICANEAADLCGCQAGPVCGDGSCNGTETCSSCPGDCGNCCGNGACDNGEDCNTCPGDCGACPAAASCCIPHDGTGCKDGAVQSCVCAMDPYCCNNNWDSICAGEADECGSCTGDCCAANGTPGCDTESCEVSVCDIDPYCCDTKWDSLCADEAVDLCGCQAGPVCGDGSCNGTETCSSCPGDCGNCCGNGACDNGEDCNTCAQDCGACGSNCCQSGHGAGCDDGTCQAIVCAVDPFCCDTNWDGICVSEAEDMCPVCGGSIPGGNCCTTGHGAGCNVVAIQSCVCAIDPLCCDVNWDGICVNEAQADCGASCN